MPFSWAAGTVRTDGSTATRTTIRSSAVISSPRSTPALTATTSVEVVEPIHTTTPSPAPNSTRLAHANAINGRRRSLPGTGWEPTACPFGPGVAVTGAELVVVACISPPGEEGQQMRELVPRGQRFTITWISPTSSVRSWDRLNGIAPDLP